jgi:hypothetical protein
MRMYMTAARRFDFIKEFNMIGKAEDFRMPDKQKEATND